MRVRTSSPSVFLVGVALALALSVAVGSAGAAGPDPNEVYVQSLSYGGSGCPQGTVGQSISNDRTTFTLIFDEYVASTGPGIPISERRKNCQLNINLHIPQGWAYTIVTTDYRGFVQMPSGTVALQTSTYYFAGSSAQARASSPFDGPIARDFLVRDKLGIASQVWSTCNAVVPLNVKTAIALGGSTSTQGQITTDSIDGKFKVIFGFQWEPC